MIDYKKEIQRINKEAKVLSWNNMTYYYRVIGLLHYFVSLFPYSEKTQAYNEFCVLLNEGEKQQIDIYNILFYIIEDEYISSPFINRNKDKVEEALSFFITGKETVPISEKKKKEIWDMTLSIIRDTLERIYINS